MRKGLFALVALCTMSFTAMAGTAELFSQEKAEVETSLAQLEELEAFVNANEGITFAEVAAQNPSLVEGVSEQPTLASPDVSRNAPLGIPSFLWGCVLGVVGLAIVYFVSEDTEETKKALWGCLTAAGVVLIYWLVMVLILGGTFLAF